MTLAPGSSLWLLRHELRLVWRGRGRGRRTWILVGLGGALWLAYHVGAWSLIVLLGGRVAPPPALFALFGVGVWLTCTLMLAQAVNLAVSAFFERGDLDLLLASPLAPSHVILVRGLGVAVSAVAVYAWLLTPFAHVGALTGHFSLLAIYPALVALGLLAAALAIALTAALVRVLGARRARVFAQILGAIVGAAFFLIVQFNNLVAPARSARWLAALQHGAGTAFDRDSLVWLPLDALLGRPLPLLAVFAVAVAAFALVVAATTRHFVAGTQESLTTPQRRAVVAAPARFRAGLRRNVLIKEWKLIRRDPQMIAHTLLQSLYMLPLAFVWLRNSSPQLLLAPALVMLSATLASGLCWLTVAAEDAPELLASAPVAPGLLRRAKLIAGLVPVWAIAAPLVFVLARHDGAAAAMFAACVAGASLCAGSIHLLLARPGRRRDLRRRSRGNWLGGVLELVTTVAWPALTWCLLQAPFYAPLPALAAVVALLIAWLSGRGRRAELGATRAA